MSWPRLPEIADRHTVSPELVLVDPELAQAAIIALPDRFQQRVVPRRAFAPTYLVEPPSASLPLASPRSWWRPGSRAVLAFAGALTVGVLLLADVRVEVGRKEAAAEPPTTTQPTAARTQHSGPASKPSSTSKQSAARGATTKRPTQAHAPPRQARRLAWAPVPGVDGYRVELFRGSDRVFVGDTTRPDMTVPRTWTFQHTHESLRPGEYRWIVWPVTGGLRATQAIVQSRLVVESG